MKLPQILTLPEIRLPLLILVGLVIFIFFLYGEFGRLRRAAYEAAGNSKACQELSRRIIELKKKPELISGSMSSTSQIAQSVEAAMVQADISSDKLVRIEPRSAKRFEKTPFLEQPSHLELRDLTMEQLIRFLHALSIQNHLDTTDLRLHVPRSVAPETGPEIWNAELVLTNTIYSP
ncbi:MAG: hypothetical protein LBJ00_14675 [Planctomycetaceae bacterium]|jgi:hypothetical protein|nr:hypothetical protein [Planctomycetaceae bacterium]